MHKNRVKLNICGVSYNIVSDNSEEHVLKIGSEIDQRLSEILNGNSKISMNMASVLLLLEYCDMTTKFKNENEALCYKIQLQSKDESKLRVEIDESRRELERMKKEIHELRMRLVDQEDFVNNINHDGKAKKSKVSCGTIICQENIKMLKESADENDESVNFIHFKKSV